MRKPRRRSFEELITENKRQLLNDEAAMEKIEEKIVRRHILKSK